MFSLKNFAKHWDHFFYQTTDARALCLFRLMFGAFLLLNGLSLVEDFNEWFGVGNNSLLPLGDSFKLYQGFRINVYKILPPTENSAWLILITYIVTSLMVMIGFKTRLASIVCFILLVSMQNRNYTILNSGDTLMRCMSFLMMFAPTHVCYSVDAWRASRKGRPLNTQISYLTVRLMQLQFTLVYLATTLFKLKGFDWVEGTAVYYTSRLENFQRLILPVIFDYPGLVKFSTWSALFIEFSMGTLVWVKELRLVVLFSGLLLHLLIEVSMSIGFFEWVMIAGYILFLEPKEIRFMSRVLVRS